MDEIKVLLVDDHKIIRDGIRALLKGVDHVKIVAEANDGQEAIDTLNKSNHIDIVLMDITMPNLDGIEATKILVKKFPQIKVMALTMHDDDAHIINMLKAGAVGYIFKTIGKSELTQAIKTISEGESYFAKEASKKIMEHFMQKKQGARIENPSNLLEHLTNREKEVLKLIAEEYTNPEIADKLFLSARTVDTHRRNLLQKLQVKNTAGLVKIALKSGLIE